ncbi:MAG: D-2-hydroxyacid dehydrogenase [Acutalibacteraceae bacterium]
MRIAVLDGHEANPGDVSWAPLMQLGETTIYDETPPDQVVARLKGQDVLVLNRIRVDEALLSQLPDLKMITTLATGYNQIDLAATAARGIPVCNVPAYCTEAVSQFTFALILEMANHVGAHSQLVRQGQYEQSRDAVYSTLPFLELDGLKLGILGYGEIGRRVANLGLAFGMQVLLHSRTEKPAPQGCRWVDEETLFRESDILSLHCPLTEETRGFINRERLALMKPGARLINVARGGVWDEQAVADALYSGHLGAVAADVLTQEPPKSDHPLLTAPRCLLTPHIAWASRKARQRVIEKAAGNIAGWFSGHPQHVVNGALPTAH